jgi:hypothetical protein
MVAQLAASQEGISSVSKYVSKYNLWKCLFLLLAIPDSLPSGLLVATEITFVVCFVRM